MKLPVKLKVFDIVMILIFAMVGAGAFLWAFGAGSGRAKDSVMLKVRTPDGNYVYPIDKDASLEFEGNLGVTKVKVSGGEVWVTDSPCENKNCIHMGKLSLVNDWAACLPNGVILILEGSSPDDFDAVVE